MTCAEVVATTTAAGTPGSGHRAGFGAPHRSCFGAAALLWLAASTAWAIALGAGLPAADQARAAAVHALVFTLGPMPLFIAGFLLTAGPRWLKAAPVRGRRPVIGSALALAGWLGVLAATAAAAPAALAAALALAAVGWLVLVARLWTLRRCATAASGHFDLALAACGLLPAALLAGAAAAAADRAGLLRAVAVAGLWWTVVPVFVVAVHRMLPFFESDPPDLLTRRWPQATLGLALAAAVLTGARAVGPEFAPPAALRLLADLPAAAVVVLSLQRAGHWGRHRARRAPMLAMLHRAWLWWTLAWAGLVLVQLPGLDPGWRLRLQDAALHALTIGFLGGTMLAMVTRVSATQAGRAAAFDRGARFLEVLLQGVAVSRVGAALLPVPAPPAVLTLAALGWAGLAGAWLTRHTGELVHGPPVDGLPPPPHAPAPPGRRPQPTP